MILSAQSIRSANIIRPFHDRTIVNGMSYGLGPNGYDVRIAQTLIINPKECELASTIEHFDMPDDVMARVADKSTWARRFLSVFNTTIDAGWNGYLTLEIINHSNRPIVLEYGDPIAKIIFERLDRPTFQAYSGIYQGQKPGAQPAAVQGELPIAEGPLFQHHIRREIDEYACSCGKRWDFDEGDEHP